MEKVFNSDKIQNDILTPDNIPNISFGCSFS